MPTVAGTSVLVEAQTQLIPLSELAPGQAAAIRKAAVEDLLRRAEQESKVTRNRLVVRDILTATDLDYGAEEWSEVTGTTVNAYETMTTGTMGTDRYIGIFGVKLVEGAGSCSALRFTIGGADRAIWQLQSLNAEDGYVGFTPSVILITQNSPYTISRYVRAIGNAFFCVLKGVVVETRGKLISP